MNVSGYGRANCDCLGDGEETWAWQQWLAVDALIFWFADSHRRGCVARQNGVMDERVAGLVGRWLQATKAAITALVAVH